MAGQEQDPDRAWREFVAELQSYLIDRLPEGVDATPIVLDFIQRHPDAQSTGIGPHFRKARLRAALPGTATAWREAYSENRGRKENRGPKEDLPRMMKLCREEHPLVYACVSELSEEHQWLCIFQYVMCFDDPRRRANAQPDLIVEIMGIDRSLVDALHSDFVRRLEFVATKAHLLKEPTQ